jgi:hypothetical protein
MAKSTGMTRAGASDWIKRIADDERQRDAVRLREEERVARKTDLIRVNGRRLVDELRTAVARDVDAFRHEFLGDPSRDIVVDTTEATGGFAVRKPASPAVTLTAAPNLETATVACHYQFTTANGLPPRESRLDLVFTGDETDTLRLKTPSTGQVFPDADALSEYLLVPVFTGRPQ